MYGVLNQLGVWTYDLSLKGPQGLGLETLAWAISPIFWSLKDMQALCLRGKLSTGAPAPHPMHYA